MTIYDGIDAETKSKLRYFEGEISRAKESATLRFMELCEILHSAHALLAGVGCEGKFKPWIEQAGFSRANAYRYVTVWEQFGSMKNIEGIEPTALMELAASDEPKKAVKEAIKIAKTQPVTKSIAKAISVKCPTVGHLETNKNKVIPDRTEKTIEYVDVEERQPGEDDEEPPIDFAKDLPSRQTIVEHPQNLVAAIHAAAKSVGQLFRELKRLSEQVGGEYLDMTIADLHCKELKHLIKSAAYEKHCDHCEGKGCTRCKSHGWLSEGRLKSMSEKEKTE